MISDTSPHMQEKFAVLMKQKNGCERLKMGFSMFDSTRSLVHASLPQNKTIDETRKEVFLRFYGSEFPFPKREEVIKHLQKYVCVEHDLPRAINDAISTVQAEILKKYIPDCIILYGSWAKGTAHSDSDVDLLVVFKKLNVKINEFVNKIASKIRIDKDITIISSSTEDFIGEKLPLFTAVKKEGKIIYGNADFSIDRRPPRIKYANFFKRSGEFETRKVEIARRLLSEGFYHGVPALCFVASKHAVQAALAMEGKGYSSKIDVLLPLATECFGENIAEMLKQLFNIYRRSEYGLNDINKTEAKCTVEYAETVLGVYKVKNLELQGIISNDQ